MLVFSSKNSCFSTINCCIFERKDALQTKKITQVIDL